MAALFNRLKKKVSKEKVTVDMLSATVRRFLTDAGIPTVDHKIFAKLGVRTVDDLKLLGSDDLKDELDLVPRKKYLAHFEKWQQDPTLYAEPVGPAAPAAAAGATLNGEYLEVESSTDDAQPQSSTDDAPPQPSPASTLTLAREERVRALFDYPGGTKKLTLRCGDVLTVLARKNSWWHCRNSAGQEGDVPSHYVEVIQESTLDESTDDAPEPPPPFDPTSPKKDEAPPAPPRLTQNLSGNGLPDNAVASDDDEHDYEDPVTQPTRNTPSPTGAGKKTAEMETKEDEMNDGGKTERTRQGKKMQTETSTQSNTID